MHAPTVTADNKSQPVKLKFEAHLQTKKFILAGLPNEYRLLLLCARKHLTAHEIEEADSIIASGVDWELLGRYALEHSLSPLLCWHLQEMFPEKLPNWKKASPTLLENNLRNLSLSAVLLKILDALQAAGIRALAYKGPALATLLYGDVALREMTDVDIVIHPDSFPAARDVLTELRYQPSFVHSRKQEEARLRCDCECEFSGCSGKVMVDLHWQITASHLSQRFSFDEFWQRRRSVMLGPKSVPTFSAEDTALVLAVHGGKHLWQRLGWIADFAESLRHDLDWQALQLRARETRSGRMLLLALALAEQIIQVQIPAELSAAIEDDRIVQTVAAKVTRKLFRVRERAVYDANGGASNAQNASPRTISLPNVSPQSASPQSVSPQNPESWLTLLQLADSRWQGWRSATRFVFASGPREWQAVQLPDSLFGFYHLVRIATLLRSAPALLRGRLASPSSG